MQLGPRIRIGGSIGHAAQQIKEGTGKVLSNKLVDSALALIPGVGPGISAGVNAAGHVLDTLHGGIHSVGDVAKIGLDSGEAYLGGKGANMLRDAVATHGVMGAVRGAPGQVLSSAQRMGAPGAATGDHGLAGTLLGYGKDLLGSLGGAKGLTDKALMAGAIAQTAADREKQARMMDEATRYATGSYNAKAPLRTAAIASLADPGSTANKTADLSSIYANPGSSYDQARRGTLGSRVPVGG